jgi:1-acyl-sn-glycerol-3-phosphate acyltransferase
VVIVRKALTRDSFSFLFRLKQFFLYILWYIPGYLLCVLVLRIMNKTVVYGRPPAFRRGGCMLVSNHQTALDSWFVGHTCFPRPVWFPAKSELFSIPVVKWMIAGWRAFPVKRGAHDFEAMDYTVKLVRTYLVLVHPEGTRNPTRNLLPGKVGVGKVIHDARCPVIPVYFEGMTEMLPKGAFFPRIGCRIPIIFGDPIDLEDLFARESSKEVSRLIVDRVMEKIREVQLRFFELEAGD